MSTPDHITRAQAIHDELVRWRPALERQGCTVTVELAHDRNIAGVIFGVVIRGTLPEARMKVATLKGAAPLRGFELSGGVIELFRDGLAPDEWRIGLYSLVRRARTQRRKAA